MNNQLKETIKELDELWQACKKITIFRSLILDIYWALRPFGISELEEIVALNDSQLIKLESDLEHILTLYRITCE